jgi:hypothetical protein
MAPENLEDKITARLAELRGLIVDKATSSVAGWCFSYLFQDASGDRTTERWTSPAKQIPFLLGVLLSSPEPDPGNQLTPDEWARVKTVIEELFNAYMLLYMPSPDELGPLAPEWIRTREVSMLAFIHYFNNGLMASVEQISDRVRRNHVPFDTEIAAAIGITASHALVITHWIAETLQASLDALIDAARAERTQLAALLNNASTDGLSSDELVAAISNAPDYQIAANELKSRLDGIGKISRASLVATFPDTGQIYWDLFSVERGTGPEIRYPTERSIVELRPIICLSDSDAICGTANGLFTALLLVCEETLEKSPVRANFLRLRDKTLEREAVDQIKSFLSSEAIIYSEAFEQPDGRFEHDVIVVDGEACLVMEAKASPPVEPFRDPDRAFKRLRHAFRADGGIQKGYEQSNRIIRRLKSGETVLLYDENGRSMAQLSPGQFKLIAGVVVTRDDFGALATNLRLLLEKESPDDAYPWAVNIIDLENLAQAWNYLKLSPNQFRQYLAQRTLLHGKVFSPDELDFAGFFIRHGSFDSALKATADVMPLDPRYASIFDDIYRNLHSAGPPVTVSQTDPDVPPILSSV